jgi:gliding motility-associated peptidyl-prolyl isomerase
MIDRLVLIVFASCLLACNGCSEERKVLPYSKKEYDDQLIAANRKKVEWEKKRIREYVEEQGREADSTATGMFYVFETRTEGEEIAEGMTVVIDYKITLLDGTECYSSSENGPKRFTVGMDDEIAGLHEAIQLMRKGEKAVFVMPSHMAYGFTGDQQRIPQNAALVYEVVVLSAR